MFAVHARNSAASVPMMEMPAATGTYEIGQALELSGGKVKPVSGAKTTTPPYICQQKKTVGLSGTVMVAHVVPNDVTYETEIATLSSGAKIGDMLQVDENGLGVNNAATGTFEVQYIDADTGAVGTMVRGRFV